MSDDKTKTAQDRNFINVNEDYELRYWAKTLGIDADRLKAVVEKVGTSAAKVKQYIDANKR